MCRNNNEEIITDGARSYYYNNSTMSFHVVNIPRDAMKGYIMYACCFADDRVTLWEEVTCR